MNERLQKLLADIKAKQAEQDVILAKAAADLTDDDIAKGQTLGKEIDDLTKQAQDLRETLTKAEESRKWMNDPVLPQMVAKGGQPEGLKFEGKAGNELVGIDPEGKAHSLEADGWGISEKQFRAISEPGYKRSYLNWMRCEALNKATPQVDLKAMAEGSDSDGGFLVPPDMANRITMRAPHPTSILSNIGMITTSRDRVMWPKFKYSTDDIYSTGVRIAWTGETGPSSEDTSLQNWGLIDLPVHTASFEIYAYRDLVEDSAFNLEQVVMQEGSRAYQLGLDNVVVSATGGTGVGRPRSMLLDAGAADGFPTANVGNPATAAALVGFVYGLPPQYADNAKFLCNRTNVFATLAQLQDGVGNFTFGLTSIDRGALGSARQPVLLGYPVLFSAFMPNGGAAAQIGIFGDFGQGYMGVQRVGLSVEPIGPGDRELRRANQVGWYFRFRFGGKTNQDRACRVAVQS